MRSITSSAQFGVMVRLSCLEGVDFEETSKLSVMRFCCGITSVRRWLLPRERPFCIWEAMWSFGTFNERKASAWNVVCRLLDLLGTAGGGVLTVSTVTESLRSWPTSSSDLF